LGVVRLAPALDVGVVEPLVVGRDEVAPLDNPERSCQLLVTELGCTRGSGLRYRSAVGDQEGARAGLPEDLPACDAPARHLLGPVGGPAVVRHLDLLSSVRT